MNSVAAAGQAGLDFWDTAAAPAAGLTAAQRQVDVPAMLVQTGGVVAFASATAVAAYAAQLNLHRNSFASNALLLQAVLDKQEQQPTGDLPPGPPSLQALLLQPVAVLQALLQKLQQQRQQQRQQQQQEQQQQREKQRQLQAALAAAAAGTGGGLPPAPPERNLREQQQQQQQEEDEQQQQQQQQQWGTKRQRSAPCSQPRQFSASPEQLQATRRKQLAEQCQAAWLHPVTASGLAALSRCVLAAAGVPAPAAAGAAGASGAGASGAASRKGRGKGRGKGKGTPAAAAAEEAEEAEEAAAATDDDDVTGWDECDETSEEAMSISDDSEG
jgi:hypothetical protein